MSGDPLERFVSAQAHSYAAALAELRRGRKESHWMWFVFPQIAGLGQSPTARLYAIRDLGEARSYLAHSVLGPRLAQCSGAMADWAGRRSVEAILGEIDAIKLRSCCTLFEAADGDAIFGACLDGFFAGERDPATLERI